MRTSGMVQLRNKIAVELPGECLPNINDLRQIFDDTSGGSQRYPNGGEAAVKRSSYIDRTTTHSQQHKNSSYFDAKTSQIEENVFENKTRNFEFERVKQKFDKPLEPIKFRESRYDIGTGLRVYPSCVNLDGIKISDDEEQIY